MAGWGRAPKGAPGGAARGPADARAFLDLLISGVWDLDTADKIIKPSCLTSHAMLSAGLSIEA